MRFPSFGLHLSGLAALSLLLPGCKELTSGLSGTIKVANPRTWSGGEIRLTSQGFTSLTTLPTVTIGDSGSTVARIDDTTLTATAPMLTGSFTIQVLVGGRTLVGTVTLLGLRDGFAGPSLGGWPLPTADGRPAALFIDPSGHLVRADIATGAVTRVAGINDSLGCTRGPGPSFRDSSVVLYNATVACAQAVSRQMALPSTRNDSISTGALHYQYFTAEVGPGTWLSSEPHQVCTHPVSNCLTRS